jgi:hypothetical protein
VAAESLATELRATGFRKLFTPSSLVSHANVMALKIASRVSLEGASCEIDRGLHDLSVEIFGKFPQF